MSNSNGRKNARMAPSIISADMTVNGALTAGGDIQVDGIVDGDITSHSLTIGETATVRGELLCEEVIVRGRVIGHVRANKVLLCGTAHVEGDILHNALAVEAGAFFEGNCRHSEDPLNDQITASGSPGLSPVALGGTVAASDDELPDPYGSSTDSAYSAATEGARGPVKPVVLPGGLSANEGKPGGAKAQIIKAPEGSQSLKSYIGNPQVDQASDGKSSGSVKDALKRLTGNGRLADEA
ncbi:MAG: polymer-forming cytoskeletal protein [Pseudomonadota bacterium]